MKTEPNDKAHPQLTKKESSGFIDRGYETVGGLTKREYFAAMAMQGILSNQHDVNWLKSLEKTAKDAGVSSPQMMCILSAEAAGGLIKQLNETQS